MSGNYAHLALQDHNSSSPLGKRVKWWITRNKPWSYVVVLAAFLLIYDMSKLYAYLMTPAPAPVPEVQQQEKQPVDPLINYQTLNKLPIVDPRPPTSSNERAVITTMYTDTYAHGVATLGHSLRAVNTSARLVLAYFPEKISQRALCIAQAGGWELQPIARIPPPQGGKDIHYTFVDQYSKLALWGFDKIGVKSAVYLDADTLVRGNFDELFDLPYQLAAGPDVFTDERGFRIGFNAGVMVFRPSTPVFEDLVNKLEGADYPLQWAEQSYLNLYFGAHALRLPFVYNANLAIKEASPVLWKAMEKDMRVVHYTLAKPFPAYDGGLIEADRLRAHLAQERRDNRRYDQELGWWEDSWNGMRAAKQGELQRCDADYPPPANEGPR